MEGAIVENGPEVGGRIARQDTFLHDFPEALLHGGDVLTGYHSTSDLIHELEPRSPRQRLKFNEDVTELTPPAGLLLVATLS